MNTIFREHIYPKVLIMIAYQLLVVLAALTTPDGVLSSDNCDPEKWPTFCAYVVQARYENEYAIDEVDDSFVKDEWGFKDARERLWHTNHELSKLLQLKVKKKSELVEASKKPLDMEIGALFRLRITCNEGRRKLIVCNDTLESVFLATTYLVKAIMAVAEGSQLAAIKVAYKKYQADFTKAPWNETFGIGHMLGRGVLDALEAEQQSKRGRTRRTFKLNDTEMGYTRKTFKLNETEMGYTRKTFKLQS